MFCYAFFSLEDKWLDEVILYGVRKMSNNRIQLCKMSQEVKTSSETWSVS